MLVEHDWSRLAATFHPFVNGIWQWLGECPQQVASAFLDLLHAEEANSKAPMQPCWVFLLLHASSIACLPACSLHVKLQNIAGLARKTAIDCRHGRLFKLQICASQLIVLSKWGGLACAVHAGVSESHTL